jgi:outer membrane immunogenic protein
MKKFVFALTLVSALVQPFVSASAADFEPPPPTDDLRPATYDWSGIYVGASAGGVCDIDNTVASDSLGCGLDLSGFGGYNYQMDRLVFGLEADFGIGTEYGDASTSIKHAWNGSLRGRMGYAFDNTMIYGTAGMAVGHTDVGIYYNLPPGWVHDKGRTAGWSIGAGVEHAITDTIRMRAEYLYTDIGSYTCGGCSVNLTSQTFRLGVSYAF